MKNVIIFAWFVVWLTGHEAEFAEKLSDHEFAAGLTGVLKSFLKRDDIPLPLEVVRYVSELIIDKIAEILYTSINLKICTIQVCF